MTAAVTVNHVWHRALPEGTELLAGKDGLGRHVEWATSLRSRPPAFDAIKGGELAFVPVKNIPLLDKRLDLLQVMTSLANKGGVAVAVLGDVPGATVAWAEAQTLPLLRLPDAASINEVQQATVRFILEQRTLLHELEQRLHTELTQLALSGAAIAAIVDRMCQLAELPGFWLDRSGEAILASSNKPTAADEKAVAALLPQAQSWASRHLTGSAVTTLPLGRSHSRQAVLSSVVVREQSIGFVGLIAPDGDQADVARLAVTRAASACAITADRDAAVQRARQDVEGDLLDSLLEGNFADEASIRDRARRAGLDLNDDVTTVVFSAGSDVSALDSAVRRWLAARKRNALHGDRDGTVVVVVSGAHSDAVADARACRDDCAAQLRAAVSAGVGCAHTTIDGVRTSHREAKQALGLGQRLFDPERVTLYADLGLYRLLLALEDRPELADFYHEQLGSLLEHDRRHNGELTNTLQAFFACHGSPTDMAAHLHLHRNTVLYRLRRLQEVAGVDLDDPDVRLNLQLALRAAQVLDRR